MNSIFNKRSVIVIGIILIGASFFGGTLYGKKNLVDSEIPLNNKDSEFLARVDFETFWKAWRVMDDRFVTTKDLPNDQDKVWGAIKGLVASYGDPYTTFFPPEESKMFEQDISGNFEGIGMEISSKDGMLTVVSPLKGSPAERAGILPGDRVIKINGTSSIEMNVEQAVKLIRGKKGTEVVLTFFRESTRATYERTIVRDVISVPTIETEIKYATGTTQTPAHSVFVIKLHSFTAVSSQLFRNALREYIDSGSKKLILDLRGNPGGYLEEAVTIASFFLPAGKPIVIEDFGKDEQQIYRSKGYNILDEKHSMVILVNNGSASASEILAGALKEHGRATVIGVPTFGKGSVQELVRITPQTSLKVTIARWLTPLGNSISEGGLKPDIEVKMTPEDFEKKRDPQMDKALEVLFR